MEQAKALNALEPFLALAKSANSPRYAADLVVRATSAPNTYLFTELLQTPQIQALASSPEYASFLRLLETFSYGTYATYRERAAAGGLPELVPAQQLKLRQLSLLTLAKGSSSPDDATAPTLSYQSLLSNLALSNARELEELVISTIYAGLVDAQLDPKNEQVLINSVSPLRDVAPGPEAIGGLLFSLRAWAGRCDATLQSLEDQMAQVRAEADRRAAEGAAWNSKVESLLKDEEKGGASSPKNNNDKSDHGGNKRMLTVGASSFPGGNSGGTINSNLRSGGRIPRGSAVDVSSSSSSFAPQQRGKRGADDSVVDDEEEMDLDEEESGFGGDAGNNRKSNKRKL
ncbi:PCI domain containing protein [Naviculisporaceae sp. PSN 640]